jgi:two-component system response regulator PilR (NtrC family)
MTASILLVDDESTTQDTLGMFLETEGYRVATAGSGKEALTRIESEEFDVIVTDVVMPDVSGLEVLERSRVLNPAAAVVVITGHATVEMAIEALRRGAWDYLQKPFGLDDLGLCLRRLLHRRADSRAAQPRLPSPPPIPTEDLLVGGSPPMRAVREQIARCAPTPSNVLITGESGTGKELVARAVHAASPRRPRRLVPVNCVAIPETLLESQLFGHVRGAFTSAVQTNPGLFVAAHGGTLFLDEIGELPVPLQAKLLRVIEERQVWAVGATRPQPVDVRLIASTNRDLTAEVEAGRFRADLFYRLKVVHVALPPLRQRREDIPLLVDHFIRRLNVKLNRRFQGVEPEALALLESHDWKGNVRELEHVLEGAMILGEGDLLGAGHLAEEMAAASRGSSPTDLREAVRVFARRHVQDVLARTQFNKRDAARLLGISLASLYRKLSIEPPVGTVDEED